MSDDIEQNDVENDTIIGDDTVSTGQTPAEEFEFKWNGKPVKANREKLLGYASQGYDYAQQIARLKQERANWEKETSQLREIQQYAQGNPDWWKHVSSSWENRYAQTTPEQSTGDISALHGQLSELMKFRDEIMSEREKERIAKEDKALAEDISGIRKAHPNFDWDTLDETGYSLEQRILKYASENKIPTFRAAFRDMMFDDVVKQQGFSAAEQSKKQVQKETKAGIVGKSSQPASKRMEVPQNISQRSYNDLAEEAKKELRATRH